MDKKQTDALAALWDAMSDILEEPGLLRGRLRKVAEAAIDKAFEAFPQDDESAEEEDDPNDSKTKCEQCGRDVNDDYVTCYNCGMFLCKEKCDNGTKTSEPMCNQCLEGDLE